jgi:ATP-dependent RNA circularization protein (DNA/RNA ligase family)
MLEYHKIQTVYLRDPDNTYKTLLEGQFARPEFEYLKNNTWIFTEKVDGTNIRVQWNRESVEFAGKTDRADIPKFLRETLRDMFAPEVFLAWEAPALTLYGEGYGARMQKGGGTYIPDGCSFILFDIMIDELWLERHNIEDIASKLQLKVVPIVGKGTLLDAVEMVKSGYESSLRKTPPEGLVMRPEIEMLNRRGERIISKIKMNDFML